MKNLKLLFLAVLLLGANAASVLAESATVTITNLETTFNGSPQGVVVDTIPAGLTVEVKYNDSTEIPTNAGTYSVTATITDPNYEGSASANFEIKKAEIHLVIGNLQQTFTGRYLPVSIALAEGQSLPLNLIPLNLNVSYALETNGGTQGAVGYTRSEGNTYFETTNQQSLPDSQTQSPPERTYAGIHTVQVSCDDGNFACLAVTFPNRYQVIPGSFTWEEAKADAEARGGHLATITSEAEQTTMFAQLGGPDAISSWAYWIGAKHDSGNWKWITGESWSYTDWSGIDGQGGSEPYGIFMGMAQGAGYEFTRFHWGDIYHGLEISYILELEEETVTDGTSTIISASATLVVAKGQLSDFLKVSQQTYDYGWYQGSNWPTLASEVSAVYQPQSQNGVSFDVSVNGGEYIGGGTYRKGYTLNLNGNFDSNNGWTPGDLYPYTPTYYEYNPYPYPGDSFPNLNATMTVGGGPIGSRWYNPPGWDNGWNGYPYAFAISTSDPNLEGTISVPFGIKQLSFGVTVGGPQGEFNGNLTPVSISPGYGFPPQQLAVSCMWSNWKSYNGNGNLDYDVSYSQSWNTGEWGSQYMTYSPSPGYIQPILPPGNWSMSVNPGGWDPNTGGWDYINFNGGGSGTVDISKKSIAFRIDQPSSGENLGGASNTPSQESVIQQTDGSTSVPVILSGVVIYDQYGRSISAGAQSYSVGPSDSYNGGYYGQYYNSGTTPPNIRVVYKNNLSNAETAVEYQVLPSAIPQYDNSGLAMVADLVYTPVESQPLPPGEYSIRVELIEPEQNSMTNFGQGSSFFDYFYMTNVSTPLATLIVASADSTSPVITLEGADSLEIFKNGAYSDPGASVTDDVDATRTITGSGEVNTAVVGNYTLTYTAQDAAGNQAAPLTRTVSVILDPAGDEDGDGLTNAQELALGTNPGNSDSDGDGYTDLVEVEGGTDPLGSNPIPEAMVDVRGGVLPQGSQLAGQSVGRFEIGKYEVTWAEWKAVRYWAVAHGYTDLADIGAGAGQTHPVIQVSWYDMLKWCNAKSEWEGLTPVYQNGDVTTYKTGASIPTVNASANGYRLPSEKEWEWAARGGLSSGNFTYSGSNTVSEVAWTYENSSSGTKAVGTKAANELGIYDMSGNVWEWCWDVCDPSPSDRRIRGGSWTNIDDLAEVARRDNYYYPNLRRDHVGFRLAQNAESSNSPDTSAPVVTLVGASPLLVFKGAVYADLGATVSDDVDASRTITGNGTVNTSVVGNYTVTYTAQDVAGNEAEPVTRIVSVVLDPAGDEDGDGLSNGQEEALGANPILADTDGDEISDKAEADAGSDPLGANEIPEEMIAVEGGALPSNSALAGQNVEGFQIGKNEVTWAEWKAVRYWAIAHGYTDLADVGEGSGQMHPVQNVAWYDVVKWCNAKSEWEGMTPVYSVNGTIYKTGSLEWDQSNAVGVSATANGYRLPTEAQWEWAASGGLSSANYTFSGSDNVNEVAWYFDNSPVGSSAVGTKTANELGIHDMSGNVWEWCWDEAEGQERHIRGGGWWNLADENTMANRSESRGPNAREGNLGFRLVTLGVQTIGEFQEIGSKVYGDAPFVVTLPPATSGMPVTLTVKSGPATISANNTIALTGVGTIVLAANQPGNTHYKPAAEVITSFVVTKGTPLINTPPSATAITYGQALSNATLSGGNASVAGSFAFASPSTVPNAGTTSQVVTFTPADSANYNVVSANVSVTVGKATPTVTWSTPASIIYGTALSGSQLNASASVNGTFSYTPASGTAPDAGNQTLNVVFTPSDTSNYNASNKSVSIVVGKGNQTIAAFASIGSKAYGAAPFVVPAPIASSGLPVTLSVKSGAATISGNTVTLTGVGMVVLAGNQIGTANYNAAAEVTTSFAVTKGTPLISVVPTASAITYGKTLANATLSGGSASVAGTFAFTSPGTVPSAGTTSQSVTFTPTDAVNYSVVTANVSVTVDKATPTISTPPTATPIVYGQLLGNSTLSGGNASVAGTFTFTNPATAFANAGTMNVSVTFMPADIGNYRAITTNATLTINKAAPAISILPTASPIFYGQVLQNSTLSGGNASVAGSFYFTSPFNAPTVGTASQSVTFTPIDSVNYNAVSANVSVTVSKAVPALSTLPVATPIIYGQRLSNSTLSGGSATAPRGTFAGEVSVLGTFAFTNPLALPNAGTISQSVTFTPTDSVKYSAVSANVSLTVSKTAPVLTWNNPVSITYGTALSGTQLNAAASVNGTFSYTPVSGTVLGAGNQTLGAVFTPADTINYITSNRSVTLEVTKGSQTIGAFTSIGNKAYGAVPFVVTAPIASSGLPVTLSVKSGPATISGSNAVTLTGVGNVVLVANQVGSTNYNAATEVTTSFAVTKGTPTINTPPSATAITYGQSLANATLSGGNASVVGTFAFTSPGIVPSAGTTSQPVTFTPTDMVNYSTMSANVSVTVSKAAPVLTWNNPASIAYGTALSGTQLNAVASVNGTFSYTPVSGTILSAGNQTLGAVFTPADTNNYITANRSVTLSVTKGNQTIGAFASIGSKAYGAAPFLVTAPIASSGLPVTLSVKSGPATISGNNTVTLTGVGTVVLAGNQVGNGNFNAAAEVTTSFAVAKGNQTIGAFGVIGSKAYGDTPFVVTPPTANSGLPVTLSVKSGNATMSINNTVTLTGVGAVVLGANQAGNANFNAATEVTVLFNVTRPLSKLTIPVPVSTDGSVTVGFEGETMREIGANYTVSAIPASGMIFKEWRKNTSSLTSNSTLKFTMEPNLKLTPVFATDFTKLAGMYNGLVGVGEIGTGSAQDMQSFPVENGFVTFSLASTGVVSGNLSIEGQISAFGGNFTANKTVSISIIRANTTAAPALLQLTSSLPGEISGNVTVSGNKLPFRALRAAYSENATVHVLGNKTYTLAIPAPVGVSVGHGFASVSIQGNGVATVVGKLATGDAISASAGIVDSGDGNWVLPLYSTGNSVVTGEIVIPKSPSAGTAEVAGIVEWLRKPNASTALFPTGFLKRSTIVGSKYSVVTGKSFLSGNATTANFTLGIDPLKKVLPAVISQKGSWSSSNVPAFTQPITSGLIMSFIPANGNIQGTFNRTVNGAPVSTAFQGVMFASPLSFGTGQPMIRGAGYFLSGNQTVPVQITAP